MCLAVERPLRRSAQFVGREGAEFSLGLAVLSLMLCVIGWPGRFGLPANVETKVWGSTWNRHHALEKARMGPRKGLRVLLLGDSQMADFINIAEPAMKRRGASLRSLTIRAECLRYLADGQALHLELAPELPYEGGWSRTTIERHCPGTSRRVKRALESEKLDRTIVGLLGRKITGRIWKAR
jgi:hypothetical protein